jgi:hypothetical protein
LPKHFAVSSVTATQVWDGDFGFLPAGVVDIRPRNARLLPTDTAQKYKPPADHHFVVLCEDLCKNRLKPELVPLSEGA